MFSLIVAFVRTAKKIVKMDLAQMQQSSGFNLDKIRHMKSPADTTLYSIRVNRSFRAVVTIDGKYMRFISLHPDHDSAYK